MPKKLVYKPKAIIKILENNRFELNRVKGSHHIFVRKEDKCLVVVPCHHKEIPRGTCFTILKQAGINIKSLLGFTQ